MGTVHGTMALRRKAGRQDGGDLCSDFYRHVFQSQRAARRCRSRSTNIHCNRWRRRFHSRGGGYLGMDMDQEPQGSGDSRLRSASGRKRTLPDVRNRPEAALASAASHPVKHTSNEDYGKEGRALSSCMRGGWMGRQRVDAECSICCRSAYIRKRRSAGHQSDRAD